MIIVNFDELCELLSMSNCHLVDTVGWKFGHTRTYRVVKDNLSYLVKINFHYSEGMQGDSFALIPAAKVIKNFETWIPIEYK